MDRSDWSSVLDGIPLLHADEAALHLARAFWESDRFAFTAIADLAHIAIAARSGMDYLLTCDLQRLGNPDRRPLLARICHEHGYRLPMIISQFRRSWGGDVRVGEVQMRRHLYALGIGFDLGALFGNIAALEAEACARGGAVLARTGSRSRLPA